MGVEVVRMMMLMLMLMVVVVVVVEVFLIARLGYVVVRVRVSGGAVERVVAAVVSRLAEDVVGYLQALVAGAGRLQEGQRLPAALRHLAPSAAAAAAAAALVLGSATRSLLPLALLRGSRHDLAGWIGSTCLEEPGLVRLQDAGTFTPPGEHKLMVRSNNQGNVKTTPTSTHTTYIFCPHGSAHVNFKLSRHKPQKHTLIVCPKTECNISYPFLKSRFLINYSQPAIVFFFYVQRHIVTRMKS